MSERILVCDDISGVGLRLLVREGFEVLQRAGITRAELMTLAPTADALLVRSRTRLDRPLIERCDRLRVIGRAGFGLDTIDVDAATECGVAVMTSPEGNSLSAAEFAIGMIFALARNIPQADASLRAGRWDKRRYRGMEITGKTLGVVGMGRVGRVVVERAVGLQMRVLVHDPAVSPRQVRELGGEAVAWDELLSQSDFITVHVPSTGRTRGMIGDGEFDAMKDRVRIINCARGGVIEESALVRALRSGKVAGAAVDSFETEPPLGSPLLEMSQVIVTPHLLAATFEAQINVAVALAEQVRDYLRKGIVRGVVNYEAVQRRAQQPPD